MTLNTHTRPRGRRAQRIAACVGLALSAGMLTTGPAVADAMVPPSPVHAEPRSDFDGDGLGDLLSYSGASHTFSLKYGGGSLGSDFTINREHPDQDVYKDIIPVGNQDGNAAGRIQFMALSADGTLTMYRTTQPTYTSATTWSSGGWQEFNKVFATGDLTGDHRPDLLARTPDGDLYLYPSTGNLSAPFGPRLKVGSGWGAYDQLVGVSDTNGDGIGDLIARTPGGDLYFFAGTSDPAGMFKPPIKVGTGWNAYNQIAGGDDMTGDGIGDLVGRTEDGTLYIYPGDGTGHFGDRSTFRRPYGWQEADMLATAGGVPAYGKPRVLGVDSQGALYSYRSLNNGKLSDRRRDPTPYYCGTNPATRFAFASDLAMDGEADLIASCNDLLYTGGTGSQQQGFGWGGFTSFTGPGDLTGDGMGDVLARDSAGVMYLYPGVSTYPIFHFAERTKLGAGWNAYDAIVGAGDYTGDGRADILARTPAGALYLYPGTGNPQAPFTDRVSLGGGWQQYIRLTAIGDINGDGKGDLLAVTSDGELFSYQGTGTGGFRPRVSLGRGWNIYQGLY
ncbi:FG-GAP repeat domain-containing protein [Streptomyces sp. NPDC059161]|uniref:FG-GAP repeat domain-containing protein n=1 Tax=Streptomyces sp. NPDC059161 TaxID=3346749 RepID=UPI0036B14A8F